MIVIDDHNGLLGKSGKYLRLKENPTAKEGYRKWFTEFRSLSRVIYGFSDCPERFMMDQQLRAGSSVLAGFFFVEYGCFVVCLESFRQTLRPFGLPAKHDPRVLDHWHQCDTSDKWYLIHHWDALMKRLVYLARTNTGHAKKTWE